MRHGVCAGDVILSVHVIEILAQILRIHEIGTIRIRTDIAIRNDNIKGTVRSYAAGAIVGAKIVPHKLLSQAHFSVGRPSSKAQG